MIAVNGNGDSPCDVAALQRLSLGELKQRYRERFGKPPALSDKRRLVRVLAGKGSETTADVLADVAAKVAVAEAAREDGVVSARTPRMRGRRRAEVAGKGAVIQGPNSGKPPVLSPGTRLVRQYRGKRVVVTVVGEKQFEYEGRIYTSLSALASEISKSHCSGYRWFGLTKPRAKKAQVKP